MARALHGDGRLSTTDEDVAAAHALGSFHFPECLMHYAMYLSRIEGRWLDTLLQRGWRPSEHAGPHAHAAVNAVLSADLATPGPPPPPPPPRLPRALAVPTAVPALAAVPPPPSAAEADAEMRGQGVLAIPAPSEHVAAVLAPLPGRSTPTRIKLKTVIRSGNTHVSRVSGALAAPPLAAGTPRAPPSTPTAGVAAPQDVIGPEAASQDPNGRIDPMHAEEPQAGYAPQGSATESDTNAACAQPADEEETAHMHAVDACERAWRRAKLNILQGALDVRSEDDRVLESRWREMLGEGAHADAAQHTAGHEGMQGEVAAEHGGEAVPDGPAGSGDAAAGSHGTLRCDPAIRHVRAFRGHVYLCAHA